MGNRFLIFLECITSSVLPVIFWVLLIFGFDAPYIAILTIITAAVHELGHITAIIVLDGAAALPRGHLSGFRIRRRRALAYRAEIAVLLAGPMLNVALFLLTLPFFRLCNGYVAMLGAISLATALSNLLPIEGYDGYGVLYQLFSSREMNGAVRALESLSFIFSVVLTFLSLYLIDKFGSGYWIFSIFFFSTVTKIIKMEKMNVFRE